MGRLENKSDVAKTVLCKQCMMTTMQCTNLTRFSSSGFAGCHNSTPLTKDLALEIRLMVPERRSANCVSSLRVDPRDTTNEGSFFIWKSATPPTRFVVPDLRENTPETKGQR